MVKKAIGESILEISMTEKRPARSTYRMKILSGCWPSNQDLIDACDKYNFGGTVSINERDKRAIVEVYTD